ncbi:MAG: methyltransferase domain-containing protein [Alphaproteobacteria bacterium]|nr:methyltransferase domain-containing protein [Alphaproteobacteria bacterium]MBU0796646.1 methyltransferase domain-containing protein [Alphaproteobacteria bacterium]MBU0886533.1 methyltransferase domain-containing protein [Alphaproteobacteria bacterium]MBU1814121.1 methyltransferase domain-containing protein [Alphaproteobacteria bacterium]
MTLRDDDAFREWQKQAWTDRGEGWDRRADEMEEMSKRFNDPLLDLAGIERGMIVLDLASGAGEPALSAARRVGVAGQVLATDFAPAMMAGIRRRAKAAGLSNIGFEVADAESLPYPVASFDRVTCRFGLMFFPNPAQALKEALRVLKPKGRAAFMVWGPLADNALFSLTMAAAIETLMPEEEEFLTQPFTLGLPGTLHGLMQEAGFADVEEKSIQVKSRAPGDRPFWRANLDMMLGRRYAEASDAQKQALEEAIRRQLEAYREGDDYRLPVHVRYAAGTKP